jgi:hypothetical protein
LGTGNAMFFSRAGTFSSNPDKRVQAPVTVATALHCWAICVKGANKRPPNTELMIIIAAPPFSSL